MAAFSCPVLILHTSFQPNMLMKWSHFILEAQQQQQIHLFKQKSGSQDGMTRRLSVSAASSLFLTGCTPNVNSLQKLLLFSKAHRAALL